MLSKTPHQDAMWYLELLRSRYLVLLVCIGFIAAHLRGIEDSPNGFHKWRETDTAMVAENFVRDGMNILRPRVNLLGNSGGVVGTELPLYTYATALLMKISGTDNAHLPARLLSIASTLLFLLGFFQVIRYLTHDIALANISVLLASASPLVFFYGAKIQPDIMALMLTVWGFWFFLRWRETVAIKDMLPMSLLLCAAGGLKPTYLFVGLPMLFMLLEQPGWWKRGRLVQSLAAMVIIFAPTYLWFGHAMRMTTAFGDSYFYLGADFWLEISSLAEAKFYQNVLLTWPIEMAVGFPAFGFFVYGLWKLRHVPGMARLVGFWMAGCTVVFCLAARHCATPHDYYYLPIVPALILVSAWGIQCAIWHGRRFALILALGALTLSPLNAVKRTAKRYGETYDLTRLRTSVELALSPGANVLTVDKLPADLLYRLGRQGWSVQPGIGAEVYDTFVRQGAEFLVVSDRDAGQVPARLRTRPVVLMEGTQVYRISPDNLQTAVVPPVLQWEHAPPSAH